MLALQHRQLLPESEIFQEQGAPENVEKVDEIEPRLTAKDTKDTAQHSSRQP
jgi:hypothetical protein